MSSDNNDSHFCLFSAIFSSRRSAQIIQCWISTVTKPSYVVSPSALMYNLWCVSRISRVINREHVLLIKSLIVTWQDLQVHVSLLLLLQSFRTDVPSRTWRKTLPAPKWCWTPMTSASTSKSPRADWRPDATPSPSRALDAPFRWWWINISVC